MKLILSRPLCFFDLETTGTNIQEDRIVQIAILKLFPDGTEKVYQQYVNPGIPIPYEATKVHNITDERVKHEPNFRDVAPRVIEFIKDCDLAGFNVSSYDIPLLSQEIRRAGFDLEKGSYKEVDVMKIFHRKEPRNLTGALKFYCGEVLEDAHDALEDVKATKKVLLSQLEKYHDIEPNVDFIHQTFTDAFLDYNRKIKRNENGEPTLTFGKYRHKTVLEVYQKDPKYLNWIIEKSDFPEDTKRILKEEFDKIRASQVSNPQRTLF